MVTKELGKITFAEYGTIRDYPYYIGLQLGFRMNGSAVMDGGKYTVNISPECKWKKRIEKSLLRNLLKKLIGF